MDTEFQSILRDLLSRSYFVCTTVWEDDDGYRSFPSGEKARWQTLTGREVTLEDFWISTGGYNDGHATPSKELVEEAIRHLTERYKPKVQ